MGTTAKTHWMIQMLSHDIQSITCALKHRLRRDGEIRIPEKEVQGFISNLDSCAEQAMALEHVPLATNAPRDAVGEGTVDAFRRAGCL